MKSLHKMSSFPGSKQYRIVWHYTVSERHCRGILSSKVVNTSTAFLEKDERPAVWFTQDPVWERTASVGPYWFFDGPVELILGRMVADGLPVMRIGVLETTAPIKWIDFKKVSGISPLMARQLEKTAHQRGSNPWLWRCSLQPVPSEKWISVQTYSGGDWIETGFLEAITLQDDLKAANE